MRIEVEIKNNIFPVSLKGYFWKPDNNIDSILIIYHGMAEYCLRYDEFANYLAEKNIGVYCIDMIGHGYSKLEDQKVGCIDKLNLCGYFIDSMKLIFDYVKKEHPNLVINCFAHSMGSILSQRYIELFPNDFNKVILSGTDIGGIKYSILKFITGIKIKKHGYLYYDKLVQSLTIDGFDKKFKNEGKLAWLSINKENIEKYKNDPLCGEVYPLNYYNSLPTVLNDTIKKNNLKLIKVKEILLITGKDDPVSNFSKSSVALCKLYQKNNINAQSIIIDNARHETLNEDPNIKTKVFNIIYNFILNN